MASRWTDGQGHPTDWRGNPISSNSSSSSSGSRSTIGDVIGTIGRTIGGAINNVINAGNSSGSHGSSGTPSSGSSTVRATLPDGTQTTVTIVNGRTQTSVPIGTVIHSNGGDYRVTGGSAGNYTSEPVSSSNSNTGSNNNPVNPANNQQPGNGQGGNNGNGTQKSNTNPYSIDLQQWFAGQNIGNNGGTLSVGGFNFVPGSYQSQDGQYLVNPVTLASAYLNRPQPTMTPDMYNDALDTAQQYYAPQKQSMIDALNQTSQQRAEAVRRGAIGRGTYASPTYTENIIQDVEKPYAQETTGINNNIASLANTMAMNKVNNQLQSEKDLTSAIVNFLMGINDSNQNLEWQKALQQILMSRDISQP